MWRQIKSGAWLTRERLRVYPLILLAISIAAAMIWIALADGVIDRNERPLGTDFSNVWVAGRLVLDGQPDAPFDPVRQFAAEKSCLRRSRGAVLRLALPAAVPAGRRGAGAAALRLGTLRLDCTHLAGLSHRHSRHSWATGWSDPRTRLPRRSRQSRPRPECLLDRGAAGRGPGPPRCAAGRGRRALRAPGLQAPVRAADPAGAARHLALAGHRRSRGNSARRGRDNARPVRDEGLACLCRVRRLHPLRRAGSRRHRLGEDSEPVLSRAELGRGGSRWLTQPNLLWRSRSR